MYPRRKSLSCRLNRVVSNTYSFRVCLYSQPWLSHSHDTLLSVPKMQVLPCGLLQVLPSHQLQFYNYGQYFLRSVWHFCCRGTWCTFDWGWAASSSTKPEQLDCTVHNRPTAAVHSCWQRIFSGWMSSCLLIYTIKANGSVREFRIRPEIYEDAIGLLWRLCSCQYVNKWQWRLDLNKFTLWYKYQSALFSFWPQVADDAAQQAGAATRNCSSDFEVCKTLFAIFNLDISSWLTPDHTALHCDFQIDILIIYSYHGLFLDKHFCSQFTINVQMLI